MESIDNCHNCTKCILLDSKYCYKDCKTCKSKFLCFTFSRNNEISICFVDTADKNYIGTRNSIQLGLLDEAIFSTSQTIEKYLKSILLYNNNDIRKMGGRNGHNILDLKKEAQKCLNGFDLDITYTVGKTKYSFYEIIDKNVDRYGIISAPNFPFLSLLDDAVFKIRPYCRDIDLEALVYKIDKLEVLEMIPINKSIGGYLEEIIKFKPTSFNNKLSLQKKCLYWENKHTLASGTQTIPNIKKFGEHLYWPKCSKCLNNWRENHYKVTQIQKEYLKTLDYKMCL